MEKNMEKYEAYTCYSMEKNMEKIDLFNVLFARIRY